MKHILFNELIGLFRNRLFMILLGVFSISLVLTTYFGIIHNNKQILSQNDAKEHIREQWDEMNHTNPHNAAHFGSYAFKPITILNSIDEGINGITGNVIRLEGHRQNDVMFSEASQSLLISNFGKLKPSLLLQFIIPLFLIFLAFNSYSSERESGRLKLLLIQGSSLNKIIFSKIIAIWSIGLTLLLITTFIQFIFTNSLFNIDILIRLILLFLSYSLYYLILISLTVFLSLLFKNSTSALSLTLVLWVMWVVFLPKIFGNTVEKINPLPTRVEFQNNMDNDRSKGIDGHNPSNERKDELIKSTLIQYGVNSLSDLPVNFRGILMQADEEYGNSVWDKHFGALYLQLTNQKNIYQFTGLINPFASLQSLSMATAGSDMFHHLNFLSQAEYYRRDLIELLNNKWRDGDWDENFYKSIKDFHYNSPSFLSFFWKYILDFVFLFLWSIILVVLLKYLTKKTSIV
ncbi:MAG: hypothetical protein CMP49_00060 [Flavobacteriales bacterium]|nr:hypothetical protein [Flavobacteriales bacterium]|tara:strand:+ start:33668 stop:35050 length:1383 start_codon:yes stop_codon:yes gene_type:complete